MIIIPCSPSSSQYPSSLSSTSIIPIIIIPIIIILGKKCGTAYDYVEQQFQYTEPHVCKNQQCTRSGEFQIVQEKRLVIIVNIIIMMFTIFIMIIIIIIIMSTIEIITIIIFRIIIIKQISTMFTATLPLSLLSLSSSSLLLSFSVSSLIGSAYEYKKMQMKYLQVTVIFGFLIF